MNKQIIFDVIRSGYSKLADASDEEILQYFEQISEDEMQEHIYYIRSLLYELEDSTSTQKIYHDVDEVLEIDADGSSSSDNMAEQLIMSGLSNLLFGGLFG